MQFAGAVLQGTHPEVRARVAMSGDSNFGQHLINFVESMLAVAELTKAAERFPNERVRRHFDSALDELSLTSDECRDAVDAFRRDFMVVPKAHAEIAGKESDSSDASASQGDAAAAIARIFSVAGESPYAWLAQARMRVPTAHLLGGSLLMLAVAITEQLVRDVVRSVLTQDLGRLGRIEVEVAEALRIGDISTLVGEHVELEVDRIMESRRSWTAWLLGDNQLNCPLEALTFDAAAFDEIMRRRNLYVHNGGLVNARYLAEVQGSELEIGQRAEVDASYLERAVENLVAFGCNLLLRSSRLFAEEESPFVAVVVMRLQRDEFSEMAYWRATESVLSQLRQADVSLAIKHESEVYAHWANRERGEDAYLRTVQEWDTSTSGPRWKFYRAALLGDDQDAARLLADAVVAGDIDSSELRLSQFLKRWRQGLRPGPATDIVRVLYEDAEPTGVGGDDEV